MAQPIERTLLGPPEAVTVAHIVLIHLALPAITMGTVGAQIVSERRVVATATLPERTPSELVGRRTAMAVLQHAVATPLARFVVINRGNLNNCPVMA